MNKTVLITGATAGIGLAIAKSFANLGDRLILTGRRAERLQELRDSLPASVLPLNFDIRNLEEVQKAVQSLPESWRDIDILINNAGGQFAALSEYINDKGWSAVINNNLNGTFFMTREMANAFFIPQKGGIIVNIIADILRGLSV